MVRPGDPLPACDLVILPGSKATIPDLDCVRAQGWDIDLLAHARRGGRVFGICGGYQMLGRRIADPLGVEGAAGEVAGLGLLDVETVLTGDKTLRECEGVSLADAVPFAAMRCMSGAPRARRRAAVVALCGWARRRRGFRARRSPRQLMSTACSAMTANARRG